MGPIRETPAKPSWSRDIEAKLDESRIPQLTADVNSTLMTEDAWAPYPLTGQAHAP